MMFRAKTDTLPPALRGPGEWTDVDEATYRAHLHAVALPQRAANAAGAAGRVVSAVVRGAPVFAPPDTVAARQAICEPCPHRKDTLCALCGCPVRGNLALKVKLATERCPDGRW